MHWRYKAHKLLLFNIQIASFTLNGLEVKSVQYFSIFIVCQFTFDGVSRVNGSDPGWRTGENKIAFLY